MSDEPIKYSYQRVPTLERFAFCDKKIRAVVGPFGCLSGDTEYLTPEGWKRFDQYSDGDVIAEYGIGSRQISFSPPLDFVKLPCESFLHLKNKYGIDQLLSDEHTVLFNTRFQPDQFKTIAAGELAKKHNSLKDGWSGRIPTTFKTPESDGIQLTDDELRLMVAISADGHFPKRGGKCNITVRKERKKDRLRLLLSACKIAWTENTYPSRPTEMHFDFIAPEKNKSLWKYFNANDHQLAIIADEFVHWDGCTDKYGGRIFSSTVKENADFIQYALATQGVRATVTPVEYEDENWKTGYRVYAGTGATELSMRQAPKIERVPSEDGLKYCFTTNTGFFIARRNGRIFVTGNSGKSSAMLWEIIRRGIEQRPGRDGVKRTRWAVIRNSFRQLEDTTMKTVFEWFPAPRYGDHKVATHDYIITGVEDKCVIELNFRSLDRPDHISNLLSWELTGFWINEFREIDKTIFDTITGRLGRYPPPKEGGPTWTGGIMDTNPYEDDSIWDLHLCDDNRPSNVALFRQPSGLSPEAENLMSKAEWEQFQIDLRERGRSDIIPGLKYDYYTDQVEGKTRDWIAVYLEGKNGYIKDGKPVYEQSWDDSFHMAKKSIRPIEGRPLILGQDFGGTPACAIVQQTPFGYFNVLREIISTGTRYEQFMKNAVKPLLNAEFPGYEVLIVGDPSGEARGQTDERTCFDVARELKFKIVGAASNDPTARIGALEYFLGQNIGGQAMFQLDPSCKVLRQGFNRNYKYRRLLVSGERYSDEPEKNMHSHIMEALQYAALHISGAVKKSQKKRPVSSGRHRPATYAGY